MFGRKGLGGLPPAQGTHCGVESIHAPGGKIDRAMQAAIHLFSEVLTQAGCDPDGLALHGPVPPGVAAMVAECVTYEDANGPAYLTLGLTHDFETFSYQPHSFLLLVANAVAIVESLPDSAARVEQAAAQCPLPLFHACVLRQWIRHVRPTEQALASRDFESMERLLQAFVEGLAGTCRYAPDWMRAQLDLQRLAADWCAGYPAAIGRPLRFDVQRINGLPVSDSVAGMVAQHLPEQRMGRAALG